MNEDSITKFIDSAALPGNPICHAQHLHVYAEILEEFLRAGELKQALITTEQMQFHLRQIEKYARENLPSVSY